MYGPMIEGMKSATEIAEFLSTPMRIVHGSDALESFRYLYGLKMSRQKYNHKEDNLLDAIAYRIAEINAILEKDGIEPLTKEKFNEMYNGIIENDAPIHFNNEMSIINKLTQLNISGDDIYKIRLGIEMNIERNAIIDENREARVLSILRQIYILERMNKANTNEKA